MRKLGLSILGTTVLLACHVELRGVGETGGEGGTVGHEGGSRGSAGSQGEGGGPDTGATGATGADGTAGGSSAASGSSGQDEGPATDDGVRFDVADNDDVTFETGGATCKVVSDGNAVVDCEEKAPPDSFDPRLQWEWWGTAPMDQSIVLPLVGNLTDDNGDGEIDLCDVPDLVVTVFSWNSGYVGRIHVLSGDDGREHFTIDNINGETPPALGDIDGDGLMEIVTLTKGTEDRVSAYNHDGTQAWVGDTPDQFSGRGAFALADIDADGDVEIIHERSVYDHLGKKLWTASERYTSTGASATVAADLNDDGDLEIIVGMTAYHPDGSLYWHREDLCAVGMFSPNPICSGFPQVADLDGDGEPEVLITSGRDSGVSVVEADGTLKFKNATGDDMVGWKRPAAIHDFDGDGQAEFVVASDNGVGGVGGTYGLFDGDGTIVWDVPIDDKSGLAAGTGFDFIGDGAADAVYADEHNLIVYDGLGSGLLDVPRTSGTLTEYPVVTDVDNDGSAEIAVVSNLPPPAANMGEIQSPTLQVIRDRDDRWIQARRIWNQHTYHVTNVREDGTIPQVEPQHWKRLNTFRTNAQLHGGQLCVPPPVG